MIGWGKKESLIELVVSYLTSIIEGGYEFHEYENIGMISQYTGLTEEELLEKIPWEEASNSLLNGGALENNYSIRPDWTVNTLKACHKNSKNKNDREYAKKALEELGVLPHEKPVESITDDDVQNFIRRL